MEKYITRLKATWDMLTAKLVSFLDYLLGKCNLDPPDTKSIPKRMWMLMENKLGFSLFMISVASVTVIAMLGGALLMKAAATMFLVFVGLTIILLQVPKDTRNKFMAYCVRNRIWIDGFVTVLGLWAIFGAAFGVTTSFIWAFFLIGISAYLSIMDWWGKMVDPAFPYIKGTEDVPVEVEPALALA